MVYNQVCFKIMVSIPSEKSLKGFGYDHSPLFCVLTETTIFHYRSKVFFILKALFVKIVVFKTKRFKVDWSGSARLLREQRKASALRSNQRPNLYKQKNCRQTR